MMAGVQCRSTNRHQVKDEPNADAEEALGQARGDAQADEPAPILREEGDVLETELDDKVGDPIHLRALRHVRQDRAWVGVTS